MQAYLVIVDSFSKYCIKAFNVTKDQSALNFKNLISNLILDSKAKPKIIHSDHAPQFMSNL